MRKNYIQIALTHATPSILMCYSIKCVYCYENCLQEVTPEDIDNNDIHS